MLSDQHRTCRVEWSLKCARAEEEDSCVCMMQAWVACLVQQPKSTTPSHVHACASVCILQAHGVVGRPVAAVCLLALLVVQHGGAGSRQ